MPKNERLMKLMKLSSDNYIFTIFCIYFGVLWHKFFVCRFPDMKKIMNIVFTWPFAISYVSRDISSSFIQSYRISNFEDLILLCYKSIASFSKFYRSNGFETKFDYNLLLFFRSYNIWIPRNIFHKIISYNLI